MSEMYEDTAKQIKERLVKKCVKLLSSNERFEFACNRVISEWENSCSVHLSNENMNRLAYMGQAACCLLLGSQKYTTCEAWNRLNADKQDKANAIAQKTIDKWVLKTSIRKKMPKIKLDKNVLEAVKDRIRASSAAQIIGGLDIPAPDGKQYFPYQKAGINFALKMEQA